MGKIIFITSGRIKYEFVNETLFESIKLVSSGKRFPHLLNGAEREIYKLASYIKRKFNPVFIYSAPSYQCLETAKILSNKLSISLKINRKLLPLRFDFTEMFTEKEFERLDQKKFITLRKLFINYFFENKLLDDNKEVGKRFNTLQSTIRNKHKDRNVLIVSHAYLIMLFSIYYKVGERMYKDRKLLVKLFNPIFEPMKRLEVLILEI